MGGSLVQDWNSAAPMLDSIESVVIESSLKNILQRSGRYPGAVAWVAPHLPKRYNPGDPRIVLGHGAAVVAVLPGRCRNVPFFLPSAGVMERFELRDEGCGW
jgi:hypothetical protein